MKMRIFTCLFLLLFLLLPGCVQQKYAPITDETGAVCPLPLPAVYSGDVPCRNCPPTRVVLKLRPDSLYFLQVTTTDSEGEDAEVKAEIGVWKYTASAGAVILTGYDNRSTSLLITGSGSLRVVNAAAAILPLAVNYELAYAGKKAESKDIVRLKGMYARLNDAGTFSECLTGKTFVVAEKQADQALKRAYMHTPHGQGEPLLVILDGQVISRPKLGSIGYEDAIVPVHFVNIQPGIDCSGKGDGRLTLAGNTWHLIEMNGNPVPQDDGQNVPYFRLTTKGNRVNGFGVCNRFYGTYFVQGPFFLFTKKIRTTTPCARGMELEDDFFRVLAATDGYRIEGEILELRNRDGRVLAKMQNTGGDGEELLPSPPSPDFIRPVEKK
jgi:copper homeostasis protein (lipoprotein)